VASVRGVYAIVYSDGRQYIGSSNDIAHRWSDHKNALRYGRHKNKHLQAAWDWSGRLAFKIKVLEVVESGDLALAEQKWLDKTASKFNIFQDSNMKAARAKQGPPGLGKKYKKRKDALL
jgi:group I intron endonuclease